MKHACFLVFLITFISIFYTIGNLIGSGIVNDDLYRLSPDDYLLAIHDFAAYECITPPDNNCNREIEIEKKTKNLILEELLHALLNNHTLNIDEEVFFKNKSIYLSLGCFSPHDNNSNSQISAVWQSIFYNPFLNLLIVYQNNSVYKTIKPDIPLVLLTKHVFGKNNLISNSNDNEIYFINNSSEETASVIFLSDKEIKPLLSIESAYASSSCKMVHLINNKHYLEIIESIGKGTSVNLEILYLYDVDYANHSLINVFKIQIAGYKSAKHDSYWKYKVRYIDEDNDSRKEIILQDINQKVVYSYNDKSRKYVKKSNSIL